MPRKKATPVSTPLHRWMDRHRMLLTELAEATGFKASSLGQISRGIRRPGDDMKKAIETATLQWERDRGVAEANLQGVRVLDWFAPDQMERYSKLKGRRAGGSAS